MRQEETSFGAAEKEELRQYEPETVGEPGFVHVRAASRAAWFVYVIDDVYDPSIKKPSILTSSVRRTGRSSFTVKPIFRLALFRQRESPPPDRGQKTRPLNLGSRRGVPPRRGARTWPRRTRLAESRARPRDLTLRRGRRACDAWRLPVSRPDRLVGCPECRQARASRASACLACQASVRTSSNGRTASPLLGPGLRVQRGGSCLHWWRVCRVACPQTAPLTFVRADKPGRGRC